MTAVRVVGANDDHENPIAVCNQGVVLLESVTMGVELKDLASSRTIARLQADGSWKPPSSQASYRQIFVQAVT